MPSRASALAWPALLLAVCELQWPSAPDGAPPVIQSTRGIVPRG